MVGKETGGQKSETWQETVAIYSIIESCHQNIIGVNLTHVAKQGDNKMVQFWNLMKYS